MIYTLCEGPNGDLTILEGLDKIDFRVLGIPINMVIHPDETYLKGFVEKEEKSMKHPLPYFLYYVVKTLPKIRLH